MAIDSHTWGGATGTQFSHLGGGGGGGGGGLLGQGLETQGLLGCYLRKGIAQTYTMS